LVRCLRLWGEERAAIAAHSSTMRWVTFANRVRSSASVNSSFWLTSPSMTIFQVSGDAAASGTRPLLRTKNLSVGVVSSSSTCSGVSATSGRSPSTTSLSLLPGKLRYCGPLGAAGAAAGCANAAGKSPPGIWSANGMAPPTAAPIAASPLLARKPRRLGGVRRPKTTASARSGSAS
jgi:hypothetical protein